MATSKFSVVLQKSLPYVTWAKLKTKQEILPLKE